MEIQRIGTKITLTENNFILATIVIDPTDNRLTVESMQESISSEAIKTLTTYLDEHFGGKQIFVVPTQTEAAFIENEFTKANAASRVQTTSFEKLAAIKRQDFTSLQFVSGKDFNPIEKDVLALTNASDFLPSKLQQYEIQGEPGIQLMCKFGTPYGIKDSTGQLVAFCRATLLAENTFYLSDTLVNENTFGSKAAGTAYLYRQIGEQQKTGRVLLIAPPNRTEEFQKNYGCEIPNDVLIKFRAPRPELEKVLNEEINSLNKLTLRK